MPSFIRTDSGRALNARWSIGAIHALYHKDGTWFNRLARFPGALCDRDGYVLFPTETAYVNCAALRIGKQTNAQGSIKAIPGYVRMR